MQKPSPLASILAFLGAACLLFAAFSSSWFRLDDGDYTSSFGLVRATFCSPHGGCDSTTLFTPNLGFEALLALLAFALVLATSVLSVITGILLFKPYKPGLALATAILAGIGVALALLLIVYFTGHNSTLGPGAYVFFAGTASALGGAIAGLQRPANPRAMVPVPVGMMAPLPGPPCITCGSPTTLVAQYGKHYCQRCNRYLV